MVKPLYVHKPTKFETRLEAITDNPIVGALGACLVSTGVALVLMVGFTNPWMLIILALPIIPMLSC